MGKLIIVKDDKVEGTDKHNVSGLGPNPAAPPPTAPFTGIGDFDYRGKMTDQLSDFVKIDGKAVAVKTSQSSLNPGETTPAGKHVGMAGSNFIPAGAVLTPNKDPTLGITDAIGTGKPNSGAGSTFVKIDSVAVLLDSDKIDTCDGLSKPANSTVTSEKQDFVSCSA
jgi:hypothetical protein